MQSRLFGLTAALTAVVTAGCGLMGTEPGEPSKQSGQITVGDHTRQTRTVSCNQVEWVMTIEASADRGRADAYLQLGGERPIVKTVGVEVDDVHAAVGGDVGKAEASTDGNIYTITGTAVGSDRADPGQTKDMPFKIEAPC